MLTGTCIHRLFEAQAAATPEAEAVRYEDRSLTYRELDQRANRLAAFLVRRGLPRESPVAVYIERSLEMEVALLGVMKAGGAYVPLDPAYPPDRLAFVIEDTRAPFLLTRANLASTLPEHGAETIDLDAVWPEIEEGSPANPDVPVAERDLCYVMYTSGSTGKPKGVMVEHRGVCNMLRWMQATYPLSAADSVMLKTPFCFDVSILELYWPLTAGARLVIAREGGHQDTKYMARLIREQEISVLNFVPSVLKLFLEEEGIERCESVRYVFSAGEALSYEVQQQFFARMRGQLINLYGPTEASVQVCAWDCRRDSTLRTVPIGWPIANTELHVLDPELRPVPDGEEGEIYIGGVQVARGYHGRPDLTRERFIPDLFGPQADGRLYRTGDRARRLPDGALEFLGRMDNQVKLWGQRIELEEIERVLEGHPGVLAAAAVLSTEQQDDRRIVAYVVTRPGHALAPEDGGELRAFLLERLPPYMVPARYVVVPELPLTPSGKLDRNRLVAGDHGGERRGERRGEQRGERTFAAPMTPVEEQIVDVWKRTFEVPQVSTSDNFFDLGGNSLLATSMVWHLKETLGVEIEASDIIETSTLAELAVLIERTRALLG